MTFKDPSAQDFLDGHSKARQNMLTSFKTREVDLSTLHADGDMISDRNSSLLDRWQRQSALEHWQTLRDQLDVKFWMA